MIRVCLIGLGKTGKEIAKALLNQKKIKLVSVICSSNSDKIGKALSDFIDCNDSNILIDSEDNLRQVIFKTKPDVVVDFSNPESTIRNAKLFSKMRINMVIGTTGFSNFSLKKLFVLTQKYHNAICYAPNITLGVNVLMLLTHLAASILNDYDFQITEIHHKNKQDIPSGTALKIEKEIRKGLNIYKEVDKDSKVKISAIRAGGVVGKHEVLIIGEDDKIEISHESFSRKAFAPGAVKAIEFIHGKVGYYEMTDVLNLQKVLESYLEKEGKKRMKKYDNNKREVDKSPVNVV